MAIVEAVLQRDGSYNSESLVDSQQFCSLALDHELAVTSQNATRLFHALSEVTATKESLAKSNVKGRKAKHAKSGPDKEKQGVPMVSLGVIESFIKKLNRLKKDNETYLKQLTGGVKDGLRVGASPLFPQCVLIVE